MVKWAYSPNYQSKTFFLKFLDHENMGKEQQFIVLLRTVKELRVIIHNAIDGSKTFLLSVSQLNFYVKSKTYVQLN